VPANCAARSFILGLSALKRKDIRSQLQKSIIIGKAQDKDYAALIVWKCVADQGEEGAQGISRPDAAEEHPKDAPIDSEPEPTSFDGRPWSTVSLMAAPGRFPRRLRMRLWPGVRINATTWARGRRARVDELSIVGYT
jgi:hypothetical protein